MSNEPMIRGGGPEAWRRLDLADEAQSKPLLCPFFCSFPALPFLLPPLLILVARVPLVARLFPRDLPPRPLHEPVSGQLLLSIWEDRAPRSCYSLPRTPVLALTFSSNRVGFEGYEKVELSKHGTQQFVAHLLEILGSRRYCSLDCSGPWRRSRVRMAASILPRLL